MPSEISGVGSDVSDTTGFCNAGLPQSLRLTLAKMTRNKIVSIDHDILEGCCTTVDVSIAHCVLHTCVLQLQTVVVMLLGNTCKRFRATHAGSAITSRSTIAHVYVLA